MAGCDANYRFTYIDVGWVVDNEFVLKIVIWIVFLFFLISKNGRESDGGVFNRSDFGKALDAKKLNLPPPKALQGRTTPVPYVLVGDDAFSMRPNLMKPYPGQSYARLTEKQRIFNYRLSRCRHTIENTFGVMSAYFQAIRQPIRQDAEKARQIVKAICALHNFKIDRKHAAYISSVNMECRNDTIRRGDWRREVEGSDTFFGLERTENLDIHIGAVIVRNEYCEYFNNEGRVHWQDRAIAHSRN